MKVGIISDRLNRTLTGVGNYVYNLIKELSKIYKDNLFLINYTENNMFNDINKIIINNPFNFLPGKYSYYFWLIYLNYYLMKNNKVVDLDIIHSPENVALFIKLKGQKKVITVHDIMPYRFREFYDSVTYFRYRLLLSKTLKTADAIIAVSCNTKLDIMRYFKIPEEKIKVIYNGVDDNYKPLSKKEVERIRQKYNLTFPYILYVGGLGPNKNIIRLIKAYYKLKKQNFDHKLVLVGAKRWQYNKISKLLKILDLQKDVIFLGYLPREDLPALYNAADLFVYPSLYEGFGLPPLEAMACGTPVITSNTSSLPEVVGDAGIMVDPYDVDGLAKAMYEVLTNDGLKEELRKRGLKRAKLFSWRKTAEETLKIYEEVYNIKKQKN